MLELEVWNIMTHYDISIEAIQNLFIIKDLKKIYMIKEKKRYPIKAWNSFHHSWQWFRQSHSSHHLKLGMPQRQHIHQVFPTWKTDKNLQKLLMKQAGINSLFQKASTKCPSQLIYRRQQQLTGFDSPNIAHHQTWLNIQYKNCPKIRTRPRMEQ